MLIVLYGTSCVGKTTLQKKLIEKQNITPVRCYLTRDLRDDDIGRIKLSKAEFFDLSDKGEIAIVNNIYGNFYGTSNEDLSSALNTKLKYVLDYSLSNYDQLVSYNPKNFIIVPENLAQLEMQIAESGREERKEKIITEYNTLYSDEELERYKEKGFNIIVNYSGNINLSIEKFLLKTDR